MIKRLFAILLLCGSAWATACPTGYAYIATITVKHNASLSADVTNWPEVFTCGNTVCKTTGNGGQVTDAGAKDVVFCTAASGGTILTYELVPSSYSATAGTAEWWILLPRISASVDQTIYAMIGHASPTDYSCNTAGTATCGTALFPGCLLTYHFGYDNGSTNTLSLVDSCGGNTATNHSSAATANTTFPPIYEYVNTNSATGWFDTGFKPGALTNVSIEMWFMNSDTTQGLAHAPYGNLDTTVTGFDASLLTGSPCAGGVCMLVQLGTSSGNFLNQTSTTQWPTGGQPHHFAVTHATGTAGLMQMYKDGVALTMVTQGSGGSPTDPGNSASNMQVLSCGTYSGCTSPLFSAAEDEFRMYNTVLSADKILSDYTFQNSPTSQYTISAAAASASGYPVVY